MPAHPALFAERVARVRGLLRDEGLAEVVVRSTANLAWLTGGARLYVERAETGVASIAIGRDQVTVHTAVNEVDRLREEELAGIDVDWVVTPWGDGDASAVPLRPGVVTDLSDLGSLPDRLTGLQYPLSGDEIAKYRIFGVQAAEAMTDVVFACTPETPESEVAARLGAALALRGFAPVVTLVAGESRVDRHRHPMPTRLALGRRGLAAFCAEREGLIVSISRLFCFRAAPTELVRDFERLLAVEAAFLDHSRAGSSIGDAFAAGARAYGANGFAADEHQNHHQGGRTGYRSRYYLASSASRDRIGRDQALAWNPTSPGLKVEDTVIVTAEGPEVLTIDARWPTVHVEGRSRPAIAVLP